MNRKIRVLVVEDSEDDAELLLRELRRGGYEPIYERVETADAMRAALARLTWDAIISDYALPQFSAPDALKVLKETQLDLPFIAVSGTMGEEVAVGTMKAGAHDYITKANLARLVPAIERELRDAEVRRQHKLAEKELRASEARFEDFFEFAPDSIVVVDGDGLILRVNARAERQFGYAREELIGRPLDLLIPNRSAKAKGDMQSSARREEGAFSLELHGRRKDGTEFPATITLGPLRRDHDLMFMSIIHDITDRKHLEDQLRQSQKMEAVGRLAGGIAHDFNNLLTAIIGYSQILLAKVNESDPTRKEIEEIEKAGHRAASLTSQLLAFSRRQVLQPQLLDLNAVVAELSKMLHRLIGEDVEFDARLDPGIGYVKADRSQTDQIIMNLAVNSRDAMPEGGKLTIETANVELDDSYIDEHVDAYPGAHVMLAISDNGCGIDKETQSRIFEPFFTTKEQGKGTGLGLSTVYGIVKQSGGHIGLYSEPGKGTTFKIYLPRVEASGARHESRVVQTETSGGTETILLVEDEESVRKLARRILEANGYTVLDASGLEQACTISGTYEGPIHMMLTDVVMPGASGREVAQRVMASRPGIKLLYMSGYTDDSIVRHRVLDAEAPFLQKPFTVDALLRKVREVLDDSDRWAAIGSECQLG